MLGVPYETFWSKGFNRRSMEGYEIAYPDKRKVLDEEMWYMGMYIESAVSVAVEHNLAGRKAKSKYLEKPMLRDAKIGKQEEKELSENEKIRQTKQLFNFLGRMGNNTKDSKSGE